MKERVVADPAGARPAPTWSHVLTPLAAPRLQRACECGAAAKQGARCAACDVDRRAGSLQRAADGAAEPSAIPPIVHDALRAPGQTLDPATRSLMEARFDHDFGRVRVHTDSLAAQSARAVSARAYTVGQDIVFASGRYQPHSAAGRELLAHELAHTIQQRGVQRASESIAFSGGAEYDRLERAAERAAEAASSGGPVRVTPAPQATLSRVSDEETGKIVPAKSKKPATVKSTAGPHRVTPLAGFESKEGRIEEFEVDRFYLPAVKGPAAAAEYEAIAGGKLETVQGELGVSGVGKTKTALWQKREPTADLRKRWLANVGWTEAAANDLWSRAGGGSEFPKLKGGGTCQMDHIVELQLGGDNTNENVQPLEQGPNQSSGATIRAELESLAGAIASDAKLAGDEPSEIKLRFASVKVAGKIEQLPACPAPGKPTCLAVEKCAQALKVEKSATGEVGVARVDYPVSAGGGSPRVLKVPVTFATAKQEKVPLESDPVNAAAATLIPGLLLTELRHQAKKISPDVIAARVDDRDKTRLPLSLDPKADPVTLDVGADGVLKLDKASQKRQDIAFTYRYLSPGRIETLAINDSGGFDWTGSITPGIPFLGTLAVKYEKGELSITKGLEKPKPPFPGVRITEATLGLKLAPEFKPEGKLGLAFGPEQKPLATALLSASTDGKGFVAKGDLFVFIPGVDEAKAEVTYRGGGEYGAGTWTGLISIESSRIKLPYVTGGSVVVRLAGREGISVEGQLALQLPGENTADVGLKLEKEAWILTGGGDFKVPKIGTVGLRVRYNTANQRVAAWTTRPVRFEIFGVAATMRSLEAEIEPGKPPVFSGAGDVQIQKGKVDGRVDLALKRNKFTGKGQVSYRFSEKLVAKAAVELDERERLRFAGELTTQIELFDAFGDRGDLFDVDFKIPIPGASIGGIGVVVKIGGGVGFEYSIGPGTVDPLVLSADFYPLEEESELKVGVSGEPKIPASASLTAFIEGGVVIDAFIAEIGGKLRLTGSIKLAGKVAAPFKATFEKGELTASITPEVQLAILLGLALDLIVWAEAGVGPFSVKTEKSWDLARREVDTGLGFSMKAPIEYSSERGVKLPSMGEIEFKKPEITTDKLESILRQLVSGSNPKEREV